jgi:hypothetical protein
MPRRIAPTPAQGDALGGGWLHSPRVVPIADGSLGGGLAKEQAMRIVLLLPLVLVPLAAGCFSDPLERVLAGKDDPYVKVQRGQRPKTQKEKIADAVGARGGRIVLDKEQLEMPVILADLHGFRSPGVILDAVAPLTKTSSLLLYNTDFSDADLERLRGLPVLYTLNLSSTRIGDGGMAIIRTLVNLHELYVNSTSVGDAGLQQIAGLPYLRMLELSRTNVTDQGLVWLSKIKSLEKLVIGGRSITDRGVVHLKSLKNLRKLTLAGTRVTDAGVRDLYAALPHLIILR